MIRVFALVTALGAFAAHGVTLDRKPGETLAGVLNYTGGFLKLDVTVPVKDIVRSFRVSIPKFCKDVEVLEAGTIAEGVYDEAKEVSAKEHLYSVNGGNGFRISGVRVQLNGPDSPSCSIPVYVSTKKASPTTDPDEDPGPGVSLRSNFCNRSSSTAWIAIGYRAKNQWVATGWWKLYRGECAWMTVKGDPGFSLYFHGKTENGTFWGKGHANFCVLDEVFTAGDSACAGGGGYWAPMTKMTRSYDGNYYMDLIN